MASILIKLLLDMWLAGNVHDTFALVLGMLQAALRQPDTTFRVRVYDLVYNLALHAHMIESDAAEGGAPEGCDSARPSRAGAEALAAMGADEAAAQGSPLCIPRGVRVRSCCSLHPAARAPRGSLTGTFCKVKPSVSMSASREMMV